MIVRLDLIKYLYKPQLISGLHNKFDSVRYVFLLSDTFIDEHNIASADKLINFECITINKHQNIVSAFK